MAHSLADRAQAHRSSLGPGVTFIGITGSCGKTTTNNLIAGLLRPDLRGSNSPDRSNCGASLADHILSVESDHNFCIQELGAWGPGTLDAGLALVQPDIGVVLNVRSDHYSGFHGLEHTQAEKAKLITQLPASGTAVLNCDDPLVWAMRERTPARVVGFGLRAEADFRAENVRCAWPDRLSFDLVQGGRRYSVQTNLIGQHVAGSALAALVVATRMGIPIDIAIARLGTLTHTPRRMAPVSLDSGVTFVRDDFKATSDSMPEVLRFLADARASRKIAVVGRISDYPGRSRRVYTAFAKAAAMVVDILVFVGDRPTELWGTHCRRSEESLAELRSAKARVHVFSTVRDASAYLHEEVRSGDLMLLKGSGPSDHLERIFLQHQKNVRCWRTKCGRTIACDACDLLETVPNEEAASSCARC